MSWPAPSDYQAAIQNPGANLLDPDLRACQVAKTRLGLPRVASGNFALVYEFQRPQMRFAVRCFTREVTDQDKRYNSISQHLAGFASPYLVDFQYLAQGIRVQGRWLPIVKMGWVEGQALQTYVEQQLNTPAALLNLAKQLRALVGQLRGLNMAHGDLQHGNILVTPQGQLKLVDYDGMFVPAMQGQIAPELGHPNYQHPRRATGTFDEQLDNFSALVLFLSLHALASNKGLWAKYHNGDNLIFRRPDFEAPGQSQAFRELVASREPALRNLAVALRDACTKPPGSAASLESYLSPIQVVRTAPNPTRSPTPTPAQSLVHAPVPAGPKPQRQPISASAPPASTRPRWQAALMITVLAAALGYAYWRFYLPPGHGRLSLVAERLRQLEAAETNRETQQQQLRTTASGSGVPQEEPAGADTELRKQQELTAAAQWRLAQAETNRLALQTENRRLAQELQTVRREKQQVLEHADKLADGVVTLARGPVDLAGPSPALAKTSNILNKEVHDYRPLRPDVIFGQFTSNRVRATITGMRTGILGIDITRHRETEAILATDGVRTYAVCHVEETPFTFGSPGIDWEKLAGMLGPLTSQIPIQEVSFYLLDPRVVLIPLAPAQIKRLGAKVFSLCKEPWRFPDAVLIDASGGYYGEFRFKIDLATPQYVTVDTNTVRGLFGTFNPSRGDLVFSKQGDLLGIMANSTCCIVLHNFTHATTFRFGDDVITQHTGTELALFHRQLLSLPARLQTAESPDQDRPTALEKRKSETAGAKPPKLAKQSGDSTNTVPQSSFLSPDVIFGEFASNRVHAAITGVTSGLLGLDRTRHRETEMILATDGSQTYAVCHVEDTPFSFGNPGTDWEKLTGVLSGFSYRTPIEKVSFYHLDPRLVLVPLAPVQVKLLGSKAFSLSKEPLHFQDALLIGARESYYGECRFNIDLATPQYVKMDHDFFRGLFGVFKPSRGDLVFSRTGELLGIMANSTYCIILHNCAPAATFQFGEATVSHRTSEALSMFYRQILQLPSRLQ